MQKLEKMHAYFDLYKSKTYEKLLNNEHIVRNNQISHMHIFSKLYNMHMHMDANLT